MRFLRKNTAVIVTVGPFYDRTDGVTIETGLTITNERITLTADTDDGSAPTNILDNVTGATSGTSNDLNYITGNDAGLMQLELTAANTNRNGRMFLTITDAANHVPVFHEFMVLPEVIYDSLILGTDTLQSDVTQWSGTNVPTPQTAGVPTVATQEQLNAGTAQAGAANTITLATSASTTTGLYVGCRVVIISGAGAGQSRYITWYTSGRVASVARTWTTTPDNTSVYIVVSDNQAPFIHMGLAAAGAAGSITFDSLASSVDETYTGQLVRILTGTGDNQIRLITAYNGTTKVATVSPNWTTAPDSTSVFATIMNGPARVDAMSANVVTATAINADAITAAKIADNAIDAGALATDTITAAKIAASALNGKGDWNIGKTGYALSSAGIQAIWDALTAAFTTANSIGKKLADWVIGATQTGDAYARLGAPAGASVSADILTIDNLVDDLESRIGTPSDLGGGATISANLSDIESQTDDIGTAGAGLTNIPWNAAWDAEVQSEVDDALVARFLDKLVTVSGTADSGSTSTMVDAARTEGDADYWKGSLLLFTSGNISGQCRIITDFNATTDTFTFSPALTQSVGTQTYVILPGISVWDDTLAEHLAAGSAGASLNTAGAAGDPWSTALPGGYGAGTAGKLVGDNLNATVSSRASQTSVDAVDDFLDTEIQAIKDQTDQFVFTSGKVNANVKAVNDATVTGTGAAGDEWGP